VSYVRFCISAFVVLAATACGVDAQTEDSTVDQASAQSNLTYSGADAQFAGGFVPRNAPFGGFGGAASCKATKTPVIFLPGNGDTAANFDFPASTGDASPYRAFRNAGYKDCELFGVNYLNAADRKQPLMNYHDAAKAQIVADFIKDVLAYTGATKVDIIGHSMGVTVALHALEKGSSTKLRKFIAISGAMGGLGTCWVFGNANPIGAVCGSQNYFDSDVFGFYPSTFLAPNPRLSAGGYVAEPAKLTSAQFYSIRAGMNDEFLCTSDNYVTGCDATATFTARSNVKSQLNVGWGSNASQLDYNLSDYSIFKAGGGDLDGVGHFRAKNNTGALQVNMLTSTCTGAGCCTGYSPFCSAK
jgi:pimeloyl-ACP methyl ester carboxylesterase